MDAPTFACTDVWRTSAALGSKVEQLIGVANEANAAAAAAVGIAEALQRERDACRQQHDAVAEQLQADRLQHEQMLRDLTARHEAEKQALTLALEHQRQQMLKAEAMVRDRAQEAIYDSCMLERRDEQIERAQAVARSAKVKLKMDEESVAMFKLLMQEKP